MKSNSFLVIATVAAVLLIGGVAVWFSGGNKNTATNTTSSVSTSPHAISGPTDYRFQVQVGDPGSEHGHTSLAFFVNNAQIDLSQQKYMLKAQQVHLEGGDGFIVHKHATGVNIPFFFATLGIKIKQDCLTLDSGEEYCNNDSKKISFIVNGEELNDIFSYELVDGDHILVNYGDDSDSDLEVKFNNVPDLPDNLL